MGDIALTVEERALVRSDMTELIDELGDVCRIEYPPVWEPCINCVNQPTIGGKSINIWRNGGPMPFDKGACPLCNAAGGKHAAVTTTTLTMILTWEPKEWFIVPKNIRVPDGDLMTRGHIADITKLRNADFMVITNLESYRTYRFKLIGEPIDSFKLVQGAFFVAFWKRAP